MRNQKSERKDIDKHSEKSLTSSNSLASLKRKELSNSILNFWCLVKEMPEFDPKTDYYQLYWTAFIENQVLLEQLKKKSEERNNHFRNLIKMNISQCSMSNTEERKESRKKHNRRCAKEINKDERCPYPSCGKYYGSEGSLNLHMKLKHDGGNKTDREKLAKSLVLSYSNNKPYPEITINLPPGAIQEEAKKLNIELSSAQVSEIQNIAESFFQQYSNKI